MEAAAAVAEGVAADVAVEGGAAASQERADGHRCWKEIWPWLAVVVVAAAAVVKGESVAVSAASGAAVVAGPTPSSLLLPFPPPSQPSLLQ